MTLTHMQPRFFIKLIYG